MNLRKVLTAAQIYPWIEAADKTTAIREMVRLLAASRGVSEIGPLLEAVLAREAKESTALEHGIAVPHGKTDAVGTLLAGIGRVPEGVDFDARDGQPARILVMTISPLARSGPHLQFLGEVMRLLRDPALRQGILDAPDAATILRLVVS